MSHPSVPSYPIENRGCSLGARSPLGLPWSISLIASLSPSLRCWSSRCCPNMDSAATRSNLSSVSDVQGRESYKNPHDLFYLQGLKFRHKPFLLSLRFPCYFVTQSAAMYYDSMKKWSGNNQASHLREPILKRERCFNVTSDSISSF